MAYVIAEAASTHDGDLVKALHLIRTVGKLKADAVKFQLFRPDQLVARRHAEDYRAVYERYAMPPEWIPALHVEAKANGIGFGVTVYEVGDLDIVAPYVDFWKVASFEALDLAFLRAHPKDRPLYVSVGMLEESEVSRVAEHADVILSCTSAYPCPPESLNLRAISRIRELTGKPVGFSDHSADVRTGALAVTLGASVIEVHVRLEETDPCNPDFDVSLPPMKFCWYINGIRWAESALGDGLKRVMPAEAINVRYQVRP